MFLEYQLFTEYERNTSTVDAEKTDIELQYMKQNEKWGKNLQLRKTAEIWILCVIHGIRIPGIFSKSKILFFYFPIICNL
jgi:hypothetical protein